ncbi:MAG TPA: class I adenylate-forming enzyme family protein [Polyangiaceae bacterium]|nr:class I adenylate-forming enzyme family protein [Polyangiaceae bacterium]
MVARELVARASISTVFGLFAAQARQHPERIAVEDWGSSKGDSAPPVRRVSYRELERRVRQLALALSGRGVRRGDAVALLSENRAEYLEVFLAAALLGATVACQNWRLSSSELSHCIRLVEPRLIVVSQRYAERLPSNAPERIVFGVEYEGLIERSRLAADSASRDSASRDSASRDSASPESAEVDGEDALLVLYTSGTTGLPKGAVLSHRAEIVRNLVVRAEFGIAPEDTFPAWSPLYHMGAAECSLGALMSGGKVITLDGFDAARLADVVRDESLGWLLLMPGMVATFADELERRSVQPRGVKLCGVMADLVPPAEIARITRLLGAPYANTFGATETGCPPCSSNRIPIGVAPTKLSKQQSPFCEVKLVDAEDREVPAGSPGELCIRGPTLFSGYHRAEETNAQDFRGGWFHMGDVFVRNPDGTLDFVDRVKYLIKSGGENIYPAEIERVMLQDERVIDVAVVRKADAKWGEVPVAFVARNTEHLEPTDLYRRCRRELAGYKQPKEIHFIEPSDFPRSASGKIQRHELEKRLGTGPRKQ